MSLHVISLFDDRRPRPTRRKDVLERFERRLALSSTGKRLAYEINLAIDEIKRLREREEIYYEYLDDHV